MIKMKAAVIHQKDDPFVIEDVELEEPKGDEVLVKISASGLCRTDDYGRTLNLPMPLVLGHEGAGVVEQVGKDVLSSYRTIIGCCEGDSNPKLFIPRLIQLYKTGRFPLEKIVTTYPFADINRAREDFNAHKVMKAVVRMD